MANEMQSFVEDSTIDFKLTTKCEMSPTPSLTNGTGTGEQLK